MTNEGDLACVSERHLLSLMPAEMPEGRWEFNFAPFPQQIHVSRLKTSIGWKGNNTQLKIHSDLQFNSVGFCFS